MLSEIAKQVARSPRGLDILRVGLRYSPRFSALDVACLSVPHFAAKSSEERKQIRRSYASDVDKLSDLIELITTYEITPPIVDDTPIHSWRQGHRAPTEAVLHKLWNRQPEVPDLKKKSMLSLNCKLSISDCVTHDNSAFHKSLIDQSSTFDDGRGNEADYSSLFEFAQRHAAETEQVSASMQMYNEVKDRWACLLHVLSIMQTPENGVLEQWQMVLDYRPFAGAMLNKKDVSNVSYAVLDTVRPKEIGKQRNVTALKALTRRLDVPFRKDKKRAIAYMGHADNMTQVLNVHSHLSEYELGYDLW